MAVREASLKYEYRQYTVYANRIGAGIPKGEIRKEYTRLRDILNKRIQRIQESTFANQGIAGKFPGGLPKLADIAPEDLPYMLQQAATALTSKSGSLKGLQQRQQSAIESFRERGYTQINESNFKEFVNFLEEAKERGLSKVYGSDSVVNLYENSQAMGLSPDEVMQDFNWWAENIEKAETAQATLEENGIDIDDVDEDLKWWTVNIEKARAALEKLKKKGENITAEKLREEMRKL